MSEDSKFDDEEYPTCSKSGLPRSKKTDLGWYCDREDCPCEAESKDTYEMIKELFGYPY